jgi:tetratricopeptide (TPR) repeat protein
MNQVSAGKGLWLAMIGLVLAASSPASQAQADEWEKHVKAGEKDYAAGLNEKYVHGWGDAGSYPHFTKAEQEFLAALALTQTSSAQNSRTALTLVELSQTYLEEGKFTDAENRGKQALAIVEADLSPDDPRVARVLMSLAIVYDCESKTDLAAPLWSRSLAILQKGKTDPEVVKHLDFVAFNLEFRQPAGAEQMFQFIVDLEGSTGASDSDLGVALRKLARVQRAPDAELSYTRALEIDKRIYSPDDNVVLSDLEALGKLYVEEGKYAAALPLLQRAVDIRQKTTPGSESKTERLNQILTQPYAGVGKGAMEKSFAASDLMRLNRNLAQAYLGIGKDKEAEEVYKQLVSMDETGNRPNRTLSDMDRSDDLTGLSGVYRHEHRYDEALNTMKRANVVDDEIANSKFGQSKEKSGKPLIWQWLSQNELAEVYREKGDTAAAEPLFRSSLDMVETLSLARGHPKLAQLLDNYATLLRDEGKYAEAEPLYQRAVETWAKSRYPEHPDVAGTLTNYAALLRKLNRPAEADAMEARAAAIRAKVGLA